MRDAMLSHRDVAHFVRSDVMFGATRQRRASRTAGLHHARSVHHLPERANIVEKTTGRNLSFFLSMGYKKDIFVNFAYEFELLHFYRGIEMQFSSSCGMKNTTATIAVPLSAIVTAHQIPSLSIKRGKTHRRTDERTSPRNSEITVAEVAFVTDCR